MDVWSWINNLPNSEDWTESDSRLDFQLASSKNERDNTTKSILFIAERTYGSNTETLVTFSISLHGSLNPSNNTHKTIWVSDPSPLSSQKPFIPLLLQLVRELITRSPTIDSRAPIPLNLDMKLVSQTLDSVDSDDSLSHFFHLVLLSCLFLLCVCDSPTEFGSLYFQTLAQNLDESIFSSNRVMKSFLSSLGADGELYFMRTIGYMLAKWLIFKDISGIQPLSPRAQNHHLVFSYAKESHGLLVLKGYAPVLAMTRTGPSRQQKDPIFGFFEAKESVLRYSLAHQQLEAVIQLEYSVSFHEGFIQVGTRVDNIRLHVTRLGLTGDESGAGAGAGEYAEERYFPSRVQVWVGPDGSGMVSSLSLGRSTENPERVVETTRVVKGSFGDSKFPTVKATAKNGGRARVRNWRWEQEAEGNTTVMEWVLCDNGSGVEVSKWGAKDDKVGFQKRYSGAWRAFSKKGGVVFAGDEYGEWVRWRVGKEMEGRVLKWKLGGKVWLSYWPNQFKTCYGETRCIEWCEEVDLPLIARQ